MRTILHLLIAAAAMASSFFCQAFPNNNNNNNNNKRNGSTSTAHHSILWDSDSMIVDGKRVFILGGEFHPFRLPVPTLWSDVLEKIKAMGFNAVSFYADWALLEGTPGEFRAEGIFSVEKFCEVVQEVGGMWIIARPGPYISEFFMSLRCRTERKALSMKLMLVLY